MIHALVLLGVVLVLALRWRASYPWPRSRRFCLSSPITWANGARSAPSFGWARRTARCGSSPLRWPVMADLTVAVEVGMALASLLYIYRIAQTTDCRACSPRKTSRIFAHTSCRVSRCRRTSPSCASTVRSCLGVTEKLLEETRRSEPLRANRDRPPAEHDRHRCHRLARTRSSVDRLKKSGRTPCYLRSPGHQPAKMLMRSDFIEHRRAQHLAACARMRSNAPEKFRRASWVWATTSRRTSLKAPALTWNRRYYSSFTSCYRAMSLRGSNACSVNKFSSAKIRATS